MFLTIQLSMYDLPQCLIEVDKMVVDSREPCLGTFQVDALGLKVGTLEMVLGRDS